MSLSISDLLDEADNTPVMPSEQKAVKKGKTIKEKLVKDKTLSVGSKNPIVQFFNKAGEKIIGPGSIYYVVRCNGKLHYKEASQVTILPEGWKEGDQIPGVQVTDSLLD